MARVFSGFRVTGEQHIGNYLGAIRNYVALQDTHDCIYCAVDVHSLTTLEDAREVGPNSLSSAMVKFRFRDSLLLNNCAGVLPTASSSFFTVTCSRSLS